MTASFGVAEYCPGETLDQWLKRTDDLMFQAKREGRNRVAGGA
jgi:PleD family two-component response regulator